VARQHIVPAALIGGFSSERRGRLRERRVWVARRGQPKIRQARAGSIGYEKDIYLLRDNWGMPPGIVDQQWQGYERRLPSALKKAATIRDEPLDAQLWLVLARFVAGLFVRTPDYADDDRAAIESLYEGKLRDYASPDNASVKRLLDHQWLSSTLLFCRWTFIWAGAQHLVTNDNGYCLAQDLNGQPAAAVPLGPDLVLLVSRGPGNLRAWWDGERWRMEGFNLAEDNSDVPGVRLVNASLALTARRDVYGMSQEDVSNAVNVWATSPDRAGAPPPPQLLYHSSEKRRELGERIFLVAGVISQPPAGKPPWLLRFDSSAAWSGDPWTPDPNRQ
jgi:hypothetical protein